MSLDVEIKNKNEITYIQPTSIELRLKNGWFNGLKQVTTPEEIDDATSWAKNIIKLVDSEEKTNV